MYVTSASTVAESPQRIVTVGGALTEIVYALGQGKRLVAVDQTSTHPADATALPDIGYLRALSAEPLLAMHPDLVLVSAEAGPPAALAQVRGSGVEVVQVPGERSPAGVLAKIRAVAAALDVVPAGEALASQVATQLEQQAARLRARQTAPPRILCLMSLGGNGLAVAGRDTAADAFVALAGGRNALASHTGYRNLAPEILADATPDFVIVSARSLAAVGGIAGLLQIPALRVARLGAERIITIDDSAALGFGPRLPTALAQVTAALFPAGAAAVSAR